MPIQASPSRLGARARLFAASGLLLVAGSCGADKGDMAGSGDAGSEVPTMPAVFEYIQVEIEGAAGALVEGRTVLIDGQPMGQTTELIEFEGGTCVITLENPEGYEPEEFELTVSGTSSMTPRTLVFRLK